MVMAQSALASASGSNEELYGKMIAQAESAVKEAQDKGLKANQALKERQETLDKLRKAAAQNRKEVKEAMAKVRAEAVLLQHRLRPLQDSQLTLVLEYIQELPAIEHPLAETEQPVGKN